MNFQTAHVERERLVQQAKSRHCHFLQTSYNWPMENQTSSQVSQPAKSGGVSASFLGKKSFPLFVSIAIVLIVGAGVAFAYTQDIFVSPTEIANTALEKTDEITSVRFDGTMTVKGATASEAEVSALETLGDEVSITIKGAYDATDPENVKGEINMSLSMEALQAGIEARVLNKTLFVRLLEAPAIPGLSFEEYKNKWFSLDENMAEGFTSKAGISTFSSIQDSLTEEHKAELKKIEQKYNLISVTNRLPSEKINDIETHHYAFVLNRTEISAYLEEAEEYIHRAGNSDSVLSTFDAESVAQTLDLIENFQGELWIGKKDSLPYKVSGSFDIVSGEQNGTARFAIIFSDWGKSIAVESPTGSVPVTELLNSFGAMLGGSSNSSNTVSLTVKEDPSYFYEQNMDMALKGTLQSIRATAEIYFDANDSYEGFCSSQDAEMVADAFVAMGSENEFVCEDESVSYVSSIELSEGFFCIDSTGVATTLSSAPTSSTCK
jgi:hypothetical protein